MKPEDAKERIMGAALLAAAMMWPSVSMAAFSSAGAGASGAQFLKLPANARAAAMAGAFAAVADDPAALDYNPAGLSLIRRPELAAAHSEFLGFFRHDSLAYAHPLSGGTLASGLLILSQDGIEKTDNAGQRLGETFAPMDMAFRLGYGRGLGAVQLGAACVLIQQRVDGGRADGFAANLGAMLHGPAEGLTLGLSVSSLGPDIGFREKFPLPTVVRAGAGYRPTQSLLFSLEGDLPRDNAPEGRLGIEATRDAGRMRLALRGGFETSRLASLGVLAGLSAGAGLAYGPLHFDLAFSPFGDLGEAYRIGLAWRFGDGKDTAGPAAARHQRRLVYWPAVVR